MLTIPELVFFEFDIKELKMRVVKLFIITLFTITLLLSPYLGMTQENKIDSLEQRLLTTESIREQADLLNELRRATEFTNIEEAQRYANELKVLGEESQSQYVIGLALFSQGSIAESNYELDSSSWYLNQALKIFKAEKERLLIVETLNILAILANSQDNHDEGIQYFQQCVDAFNDEIPLETQIKLYTNFSRNYIYTNNLSKSLEVIYKALELSQSYNDYNLNIIYEQIAAIYKHQSEETKAIDYLKKSIEVSKKQGDIRWQFIAQVNLIDSYKELEQYDKALELALHNLAFSESANDYYTMIAQNRLASVYLAKKDTKSALPLIKKVDKYMQVEVVSSDDSSTYFYNRIDFHLARKEHTEALKYALLDYKMRKNISGYKAKLKNSLQNLYLVYKELGNNDKALIYYEQFQHLQDSITNEESIQKLATEKLRFEFEQEKKSQEILAKANQERQNTIKWTLIFIALFLAFIALIIFINYKKETKNKEIIAQQKNELEALYNHKNELFTNISHELQTPLTLIMSSIRSMKPSASSSQTLTNSVERHVNSLQQITQQVLDLAKSKNKTLTLTITSFLLKDLIQYFTIDFRSIARYRDIQFNIHSIIEDDYTLHTDGYKLFTIVKNLLSNAFKFTPSGGSISLNINRVSESHLNISVQDSGKGIEEKDLSLIFNRYFQASEKKTNIEGGMGIGLAVCQEYIKLLNGDIKVVSQVGKGSIFTIEFPPQLNNLPIDDLVSQEFTNYLNSITSTDESIFYDAPFEEEEDETTPCSSSVPDAGIPEKTPILVVEDNISMCQYLKSILSPNYSIAFAPHGKKALNILEQQYQPHAIISDLMMPEMDGLTLMKVLKAKEEYMNIPVLMLTARDNTEDKIKAFRVGVEDYLTKPFLEEELHAHLNLLINNYQERINFQEELKQVSAEATNSIHSGMKIDTIAYNLPEEDILWLEKLKQVVLDNMKYNNFTVNTLADEMAVSYTQIFRDVKRLTGFTPYQYIKEVRLLEAKKLLESKRFRTVKAVSYHIGQNNVKHFSITFKKRFGRTPSEYLKS